MLLSCCQSICSMRPWSRLPSCNFGLLKKTLNFFHLGKFKILKLKISPDYKFGMFIWTNASIFQVPAADCNLPRCNAGVLNILSTFHSIYPARKWKKFDSLFLKERAEGFSYKMAMENTVQTHQLGQITLHSIGLEGEGWEVCFNDFKDGEVLPSRFFLGENGCNFVLFIYTLEVKPTLLK